VKRPATGSLAAGAAAAVVVIAVTGALVYLGPPAQERDRQLDVRRAQDLRAIATAADLWWTRNASLPASLAELARESTVRLAVRDPGTGQEYEYRLLGPAEYELCAVFQRPSPDTSRAPGSVFWSHGAGRWCFALQPEKIGRAVDATAQPR